MSKSKSKVDPKRSAAARRAAVTRRKKAEAEKVAAKKDLVPKDQIPNDPKAPATDRKPGQDPTPDGALAKDRARAEEARKTEERAKKKAQEAEEDSKAPIPTSVSTPDPTPAPVSRIPVIFHRSWQVLIAVLAVILISLALVYFTGGNEQDTQPAIPETTQVTGEQSPQPAPAQSDVRTDSVAATAQESPTATEANTATDVPDGAVVVDSEVELEIRGGTLTLKTPKNISYMKVVHRMIADGPDSPVWNAAQRLRSANAGNLGYYDVDPEDSVGLVANPLNIVLERLADTNAETATACSTTAEAIDRIAGAMADVATVTEVTAEANIVNAERLDQMISLQSQTVEVLHKLTETQETLAPLLR